MMSGGRQAEYRQTFNALRIAFPSIRPGENHPAGGGRQRGSVLSSRYPARGSQSVKALGAG